MESPLGHLEYVRDLQSRFAGVRRHHGAKLYMYSFDIVMDWFLGQDSKAQFHRVKSGQDIACENAACDDVQQGVVSNVQWPVGTLVRHLSCC